MKKSILFLFSTILMMSACGSKQQPPQEDVANDAISMQKNLPGDSALYGLACDGCTDSVLVFLPYSGGDPAILTRSTSSMPSSSTASTDVRA